MGSLYLLCQLIAFSPVTHSVLDCVFWKHLVGVESGECLGNIQKISGESCCCCAHVVYTQESYARVILEISREESEIKFKLGASIMNISLFQLMPHFCATGGVGM